VGISLAIHKHIAQSHFDAVTVRIMVEAYEAVRRELQLPSGGTPTNMVIAGHVLQLVQNGERDPEVIAKRVLLQIGRI
jgi:hypothetical protein